MEQPHADIWLSELAEERIVLECLLSFASNGATGFGEKRISRFSKTGAPQAYVKALERIGVLVPQDGCNSYTLDPHKAVEYFSKKGKNAAEILKKKYPKIDLDGALAAYAKVRARDHKTS